jgi:hypothetical protein
MERAGFEPAASGLQTPPITRPHLTGTNRIGMTEPDSAVLSDTACLRSTRVRSHRARTADALMGNEAMGQCCSAAEGPSPLIAPIPRLEAKPQRDHLE